MFYQLDFFFSFFLFRKIEDFHKKRKNKYSKHINRNKKKKKKKTSKPLQHQLKAFQPVREGPKPFKVSPLLKLNLARQWVAPLNFLGIKENSISFKKKKAWEVQNIFYQSRNRQIFCTFYCRYNSHCIRKVLSFKNSKILSFPHCKSEARISTSFSKEHQQKLVNG